MNPLRTIFAATALCGTLLCAQTPPPELLAVARLAPAARLFPAVEDIGLRLLPFFPARAALDAQWASAGLPSPALTDAEEGPALFAFSDKEGNGGIVLSVKYKDEATAKAALKIADSHPRLHEGARVFSLVDTFGEAEHRAPIDTACLKRAAWAADYARCAKTSLFEIEYFPAAVKFAAAVCAEDAYPDQPDFLQNLSGKIDAHIDGGLFALARVDDALEISLSLRARETGSLARLLALPLGGEVPQAAWLPADHVCVLAAMPEASKQAWLRRLGALVARAFPPESRARFEGLVRTLGEKSALTSEATACDIAGERTRALARPAPSPDVLYASLAASAELAQTCANHFLGATFSQTLKRLDTAGTPLLHAERNLVFAPEDDGAQDGKNPPDSVASDGDYAVGHAAQKSECYFAIAGDLLASASTRDGIEALVAAANAGQPVADSVADRLGTSLPENTFLKAAFDLPALVQELETARTGEPLSQVGLALNALKTDPALLILQTRDATAVFVFKVPLSSASQIASAYARAFFNAQ